MKSRILSVAIFGLSIMAQLTAQNFTPLREQIQLAGEWQSSLGPCRLPGTTDENRLGEKNRDTLITYLLTRLYPYSGEVTYTREIEIPKTFRGKKLFLVMERTKPSTLWVDGDSIGSYGHLYAPHRYELPVLAAGKHQLRIRIDNSPTSVPKETGMVFWESFISKRCRMLSSSRCRYIRKWIRNRHWCLWKWMRRKMEKARLTLRDMPGILPGNILYCHNNLLCIFRKDETRLRYP